MSLKFAYLLTLKWGSKPTKLEGSEQCCEHRDPQKRGVVHLPHSEDSGLPLRPSSAQQYQGHRDPNQIADTQGCPR